MNSHMRAKRNEYPCCCTFWFHQILMSQNEGYPSGHSWGAYDVLDWVPNVFSVFCPTPTNTPYLSPKHIIASGAWSNSGEFCVYQLIVCLECWMVPRKHPRMNKSNTRTVPSGEKTSSILEALHPECVADSRLKSVMKPKDYPVF